VAKLSSTSSTRIFSVLLGIGLLAYVVLRTGPQRIWSQVEAIGWGIALIIVLGGIAHLVKTCVSPSGVTSAVSRGRAALACA
jgi:hypothetical protein